MNTSAQPIGSNASEIVIDLTCELNPEGAERKQLIHYRSAEKLRQLVEKVMQEDGKLSHSTVCFINGTRGAGKSTFLNTMAKDLADTQKALLRLPTIDPSMIEMGEQHILFSILQYIKQAVEEKETSSCQWHDESSEMAAWRKSLEKLARGANLLNHKSSQDMSMDDLLGMDEGLSNARSGAGLQKSMQEFIQHSLDVLKKKSILLAFDDVDTHFKRGWEVLEMIRRYLQSAKLIILITGDLQLYTHLVRGQQFRQFDDELHKVDSARETERKGLVDHLEQQYLMKLFPLENRIHLYPLAELIEENRMLAEAQRHKSGSNQVIKPCPYVLKQKNSESREDLTQYVGQMVRDGFLIKGNVTLFTNFFLNLPIRAVLQILRQYHSASEESAPKRLAETLRGALIGYLYQAGVDVDALSHSHMGKLIEAVFDVVVSDGEFDTGIYLRPQPSDEGLRNVYFALSAEVAAQCDQKPERALRYLLAGLGAVSLVHKQRPVDEKLSSSSEYVRSYKKEMSVGRDEDALNWARYAAPCVLNLFLDNKGIGPGVLKLNFRANKNQTGKKSFDRVLRNDSREIHPLQQIAFRVATHQVEGGTLLRLYMSVFNLLGAMERLLLLRQYSGDKLKSEIQSTLNMLLGRATVTAPSWTYSKLTTGKEAPDPASEDDGDEGDENIDPAMDGFIKRTLPNFEKWIQDANELSQSIRPSALFLGKIWPRLYFSLAKVAEENETAGAGDLMHLNVLCVINAFLVEEQDHHLQTKIAATELPGLDRINPVTSSYTFFNKILKIQAHFDVQSQAENQTEEALIKQWDQHFPLTMLIARCPLLAVFLQLELGKKPKTLPDWTNINTAFFSMYLDSSPTKAERDQTLIQLSSKLGNGLAILNAAAIVGQKPKQEQKQNADSSAQATQQQVALNNATPVKRKGRSKIVKSPQIVPIKMTGTPETTAPTNEPEKLAEAQSSDPANSKPE